MSYKALVVEDEAVERALLEDLLFKLFPVISNVYTAANGIDGLRLVEEKQPDILLLDISMPGLSGLDLMEILTEGNYPGKVLFITAYDYFNYAKRAIDMGAVGYILKPITEKDLQEGLSKCFSLIEKDRETERLSEGMDSICSYAERYLLHDLVKGSARVNALTGAYAFSPDGSLRARLIVFHFWHILPVKEENSALLLVRNAFPALARSMMSFEKNDLIIFSDWDKDLGRDYIEVAVWVFLQNVLSKIDPDLMPEWASATAELSSYNEVRAGYERLLDKERRGGNAVLRFEPMFEVPFYSAQDREARVRKAVWGIRDGQPSRLTGAFHSLFTQDQDSAEGLYLVLLALREFDKEMDLMDVFLSVKTDNIQGSLDKWAEENIGGKESSGNTVIEEALRMMMEEYSSPGLSQTVVAERFGLNPAYFSRLFKKETGQKFITVMGDIRMGKAKELLDKGVDIDEVSSRCGYSSRQYFQEAFRNRFGMSVAVYQGKGK